MIAAHPMDVLTLSLTDNTTALPDLKIIYILFVN
jgi:hypothetical protein